MKRAVVAAGGWAHPPDDLVSTMGDLLAEIDIAIDPVVDPTDLLSAIEAPPDLLVVGACWFGMHHDRYSPDQRAQWAVELDQPTKAALVELKVNGCPLLAMHTAPICFDGWDVWCDWLGATWNWQTSWHPPPAQLTIESAANSPLPVQSFEILDEEYQELVVDGDVDLVARSGDGHPLVWLKRSAVGGRSAVNLLGHDHRSLNDTAHRQLNRALLDWLLAR